MPGTNRVRNEQVQPHSASYLPGLLPQVQALVKRLAEIVVPKLSGAELYEVIEISSSLGDYEIDLLCNEASHNDPFFFGCAFHSVAKQIYPTVATLYEMTFDVAGNLRDEDRYHQPDYDAMVIDAVDHDRNHPGFRSITGKC
jgi:hypothetical protein